MPVPHFTYHGDFFKADRQGIRGSFFDSDRVDLTVSLALSPPVSSDDITARTGMPDLKGTFVKVQIAVARGKKLSDKRETLKKKAVQRDLERELS